MNVSVLMIMALAAAVPAPGSSADRPRAREFCAEILPLDRLNEPVRSEDGRQ